jgi:preprotein translocase subunit YajC
VVKVTDDVDTVDVEIATGVKVQIVRAMIADVRSKNEPVKAEPVKAKSIK